MIHNAENISVKSEKKSKAYLLEAKVCGGTVVTRESLLLCFCFSSNFYLWESLKIYCALVFKAQKRESCHYHLWTSISG